MTQAFESNTFNHIGSISDGDVVKHIDFKELTGDQARQAIDARHIFEGLEATQGELDTHFAGSMSWKCINSVEYLYRIQHRISKSLGARSPDTENIYKAFKNGRAATKSRTSFLTASLGRIAPLVRAHRLGQMTTIAARILQRLEHAGMGYPKTVVVGATALHAYEASAGVMLDVPTAWQRCMLLMTQKPIEPLLSILRKVDASFQPAWGDTVCVENRHGFRVQIVRSEWIANAPSFSEIVFAQDGLPLRLQVPDPRWFAAYKFWSANRDDRSTSDRQDDLAQAEFVAILIGRYMQLPAIDEEALPADCRPWLHEAAVRVREAMPKAAW